MRVSVLVLLLLIAPIFFVYKNLSQEARTNSTLTVIGFTQNFNCNFSEINAAIEDDIVIINGSFRIREALCMKLIPIREVENDTLILNVKPGRIKIGAACKDKNAYPVCYEAKIIKNGFKRIRVLHNYNLEKEIVID